MTLIFLAAACAVLMADGLHLASASASFHLRLDHYENFQNLLKVHAHCDSGNLCDPAFIIRVRGSWGQTEVASDCTMNANQINFGDKIGTNLSNPISFTVTSIEHNVLIDVGVKDCHMGLAYEDIGDFQAELTQMPRPFLFNERVNLRDNERAMSIDLTPTSQTPLSIKLRATVWRQCAQFYYGNDCSKFCRPTPMFTCHPVTGQLCQSASNCHDLSPQTKAAEPTNQRGLLERTSAGHQQPEVGRQQSQPSSVTLIASLSCLLALLTVSAAVILIVVRHCGRPKKRSRASNRALIPPTHSMAVGLRDAQESLGSDSTVPSQQDFSNAYYGQTRMHQAAARIPPAPAFPQMDSVVTEEESEYEMPVDQPQEPPPPPLPLRTNAQPPLPIRESISPSPVPLSPLSPPSSQELPLALRTPMSRSFSKPGAK